MQFDPQVVHFRNVRSHQSYSTSLCVTNTLDAVVDFTIRASSSKVTVSPGKIHLNPQQSIVVTLRLFLNQIPNHLNDNLIQEYVHFKSTFLEHKIPIEIHLASSTLSHSRSRSPSPSIRGKSLNEQEISLLINSKDAKIQELQEIIGYVENKTPNFQQIIQSKLEEQEKIFEEKSAKVIIIIIKYAKLF
jgi:hypothetical protein